jgi:hypothetical protein
MSEFSSPWLETAKTPPRGTDSTASQIASRLAVSAVSETTKHKTPFEEPEGIDDLHAFIAELPPIDMWNVDETVARILAMTDEERAKYSAALIHDWRAWRLALERFGDEPTETE